MSRPVRFFSLTLMFAALCLGGIACGPKVVSHSNDTRSERPADRATPPGASTDTPAEAPASAVAAGPAVSPERFLSHIAMLAHDELEGRDTGSDGIDLAAGYVAGQFAAAGLEPGGPGGTYFQPFTISRGGELGAATTLVIDGKEDEFLMHVDFLPFGFSKDGSFDGDAVFAGYGITNAEQEYDDYGDLDVQGKILLMLRREPPGWDPDGGYTDHARFDHKVALAAKHGAAAVLVVNQDPGEDGYDGLMRFRLRSEREAIPVIHVTREVADQLLQKGGAESITALQTRLDEQGSGASVLLAGVRVSGEVVTESDDMLARNVIGALPGNGPHSGEYIVIGGHYDHIGVRYGSIHNGADDNASGTAGVIELAHMLAATPRRDRSIIFMAFTGEEMGLHGSRHFVADPTVEIDSIIAMLNLDMIGRLTEDNEANELGVFGVGTGASFKEIVASAADAVGIECAPESGSGGGSDHASFYQAGIPSLFFFTGIHEDYHQPSDDTEKINAAGGAKIIELVYRVATAVINDQTAPVYAKVAAPSRSYRAGGPAASGVVMGIMPDFDDDTVAEGWPIARVFANGGAAKAGMKAGDRIMEIDGSSINSFADFRTATAERKPGDVVGVSVLRGAERLTLRVELSARGG